MPVTNPRILIATTVEWESLSEIPYVFDKGGCVVDILCPPNAWILKNSFYNEWINSELTANFMDHLLALANNKSYDWIIPLDDILLKMIREHPISEEPLLRLLPLSKPENIDILASKSGLERVSNKYNFHRPKTLYSDNIPSIEEIEREFSFPVLVKLDHSWGGIGIVYSPDFPHLKSLINSMPEGGYLVQEYIKGKDIGVESLFKNGSLLTHQLGHVIEYTGTQFEPTIRRKYFRDHDLSKLVAQIGADIGIHGFASMQFIFDEFQNRYYLLEVDLRPQAWCRYGEMTGNDFSEGIKRFTGQLNDRYLNNENDTLNQVEVVLFHKSLIAIVRKRSFIKLIRFLFNFRNWRYIPFYDSKYLKHILIDVKDRIYNGIREKYISRN